MGKVTIKSKTKLFDDDDLAYALENAAEFLENEECPEDDGGRQVAANHEGARRIKAMLMRLNTKISKNGSNNNRK